MAYSQTELDALKSAYAAGVTRVRHDDKLIDYGTAADLLSRIRVIEAEMRVTAGTSRPVAGYAGFSRGGA